MAEPDQPDRTRRTSITRMQRQTAAGAELISLCQTITEDGHLADQEIAALRQWLDQNRGSDLPAVAFLSETVERILADGKVTTEEQQELYRAIETVLPPDIRVSVRGTRVAGERAAKESARLEKQAQQEERARNSPVGSWDFMVAGVRHEGRPEIIQRFARPGRIAYLVRDRGNPYSRSAVEVRLPNGMQVGYVPEEHAREMAPLLDSGHKHGAHIKKILVGGRSPIPIVVASLYSAEADRPEAVSEQQVPQAQHPPPLIAATGSSARRGCLLLLMLLAALVGGAAWAIVAR